MKILIILVNYKDYAKKYLSSALESIRNLNSELGVDIMIVDNASSKETEQYLKEQAPEAKLILNKDNDGFAKGNNDALNWAKTNNYDYSFLLNMDASLEKNAILELIKVSKKLEDKSLVQARLMLDPDRDKINSLGNCTHYLGFGYCDKYKEEYFESSLDYKEIAYGSGAALLIPMQSFAKLKGFDEELWMYNEDQDLSWRYKLAGYSTVIAYRAIVYHQYEFSRSISKFYYLERNRLIVAWKNYSTLSLILFFPALVLMEFGTFLFSIKSGWFKEKLRVYSYFLNTQNWKYLKQARRNSQSLRVLPDYKILALFSPHLSHQELDNFLLKYLVNPIFGIYFKLSFFIIKLCRQ